jgi:hypothetical protein
MIAAAPRAADSEPVAPRRLTGGWFRIENAIVDEYLRRVTPSAFVVYAVLRRFADVETGQCWPTITKLAELAGMSRRNVQMILAKLTQAGFIAVEKTAGGRGPNATHTYTVLRLPPAQRAKPASPLNGRKSLHRCSPLHP